MCKFQGRQGNFGGQDRDDKRGFGRAALAGVGDGVVNRARNNAVGQPSMYRVRGPDSNSRAREAGRLAVEAMARVSGYDLLTVLFRYS